MTIYLYKNISEIHRVAKVLNSALEITGTLRDSTSVTDPSFVIESSLDLSQYNYCRIPEFNRYYFINSISVIRTGLWSFNCHVDVLTTYSSNIRSLSAVISRQEYEYNLYLNDDKLLVECDRDIMTLGFSNPLKAASSGKSIVLTVAGGTSQNE